MADPLVLVDISVSVDGFIARPNDEAGPIHEWFFGGQTLDPDQGGAVSDALRPAGASQLVLQENQQRPGAVIAGRRTYDFARGWNGNHPSGVPVVVVTHQPPPAQQVPTGPTRFTFSPGVEAAVATAKALADGHPEVHIMGGSTVIAQALDLGLVDEMQIHITPVLMGSGIRLVDTLHHNREVRLQQTRVIDAPDVTHIRYRVTSS